MTSKRKVASVVHACAGTVALLVIACFWFSTVIAELFLSRAAIVSVKHDILYGMAVLVPCLAATGGSGFALGKSRPGQLVTRKKRRMQLIALNGLLVLVPCAAYLYRKATVGQFDSWFYTVQVIELVFGAANLYLTSLNMRDGLKLANRFKPQAPPEA